MRMKSKLVAVCSICLFMLGSSAVFAAGPLVAVSEGASVVRPFDAVPAGQQRLYSNLGTGDNKYNPQVGWIVFGPQTGFLQWMGMPFTPNTDALVQTLKLAIGNQGGTVTVTILFAEDKGGIPGKTLRKWHVKNLFPWGGCCSLDTAKDKTGIPVKKGQLYWIVAKTDASNADASDVWAYTWNSVNGDISYNVGEGWKPDPNQPLAAYAVYGTKQ
jgi:hypothetical protein